MPVLIDEQTGGQAICIYIDGGQSRQFENVFKNHHFNFTSYFELVPNLYSSYPSSYFVSSQGPLVRIYLPNMGASYKAEHIFDGNHFLQNRHYQAQVEGNTYTASLIVIDSDISSSKFTFKGNTVMYNSFIGEETALISVNGPIMRISNNAFTYNGKISPSEAAGQAYGVFRFVFKHEL